jgi:hypothetical protein
MYWIVECLFNWLVDGQDECLIDWMIASLDVLDIWVTGCLAEWMVECLFVWLVDELDECLIDWIFVGCADS